MSVLLDGQAIPAERAVATNRLRLKVERLDRPTAGPLADSSRRC